ncbi:MAG: class I SAM-dependent methyltransferase [Deltaproteobacteria bacterium]|nr:class I SAM-dependent methyltransferase [Deltaproteobacteria bacterium]
MDVLTALSNKNDYSRNQLQMIVGAWVLSGLAEKKSKISLSDGDVSEDDYDKKSLYALLYALYRSMGEVRDEHGERYEFTFNTWGYAWPEAWGPAPTTSRDPQRYGRNAYTGLYHFDAVKKYVADRDGKVHIVEMGCGTGAGAHQVCANVLKQCTYEAVDMQRAAIATCNRKFVPTLNGRLKATCSDATQLARPGGSADFVAVNETHVTEITGVVTEEDERFFKKAHQMLKVNGHIVWGNAIPDPTWKACYAYLESIGFAVREECDVTEEAVRARDEDKRRIDVYVDQCMEAFPAFRIPVLGARKRAEAEVALKNFARNPNTRLYQNMVDGTDTYKVVLLEKTR